MRETGPDSTTRPAYITANWSHILATMPRLWVMKISARPCARCSSRKRFRYWAWIVRSRLVVGSSAIKSRGSQEMPMAPTMRWRMPPDISCGYCLSRVRGDAHRLQQLEGPSPGGAALGVLVHPDRLRHLIADGKERVEGSHRILQDH